MADTRPIPTPLAYRWRRFLQQFLPVIIFLFCIVMTIWLWDRQSLKGNATGIVDSQFVDVSSGMSGILLPPLHGRWELFQHVNKNDVIGAVEHYEFVTFDARLATIDKQKLKVLADFKAAKTRFLFDIRQQNQGQWFDVARTRFDVTRTRFQVQGYQLDIMDRTTRIEFDKAERKRLQESFVFDKATHLSGATSKQLVVENRLRIKAVERRIEAEEKALVKAEYLLEIESNRLHEAQTRLAELDSEQGAGQDEVIAATLAAYKKQFEVLNAQAEEIEAERNALVIHAPIDGIITQVFKVPGQSVQPGDPVVRIADSNAHFIVSYIRHQQRIPLKRNMVVRVRARFTGNPPVETIVLDVGQNVEEVPLQHRMDPTKPEWGLPVKIEVPDDMEVRPGETIDIIFPRHAETADELKTESNPANNFGV